ncbi:uncharacterized protein OCT59_012628 [Rhizophagus irregularis]|uniref:uncharacterized protein n=1 Tax=Rhizophagus irregularis TaxID=588596 RepID=UPI00331B2601|nr:hypothetical protein OCT59_012628 [Rhizophagus irregularis]
MAGIPHLYFDWDNSIPDFLAQLRLDLQNQGIDPNDNVADPPTGRDNAIGHLRACMRGRTLEWFDDEITTKQNWELTNLLDNIGQANLVALKAVEDAWNEYWRIAGGCPTNDPVNAPNANTGNTVVVAGIRFCQAVWWLKTHFPTVEEELQDLMYGTIRKGDMTIDELYRKILRIGRRANYRPEELRRKFLDALPLLWLEKAEDIVRHKRDRTSDLLVSNRTSQQIYEPSPILASQQHGISFEDMQKAIQNALAQQKTEYQSLLEKQKADFQSQMVQQTKKIPPPVPPKNMEQLLDTYESANPFPDTLTRKEIMRVVAKAYGPPPKPQKPEKLQSSRIDRLESKIDEIGQMTSKFGRISLNDQSRKPFYCSNCGQEGHKKNNCPRLNPVAKSNFTQCYYPQLPSTQPQYTPPDSDNEEDGYDKPKTYDELFPKLSPAMRKMCQSHTVQKKESISDEWFSSLQYLNVKIDDLMISNSFLDSASEFRGVNDATINALGIKDKDSKTVTATGNFIRIDNGEPEPMLCLGMTWIRKVQGVLDPNKNQF